MSLGLGGGMEGGGGDGEGKEGGGSREMNREEHKQWKEEKEEGLLYVSHSLSSIN